MIQHIVLFKFKETADLHNIAAQLLNLKDSVPGVQNIRFGSTFTNRGQGYTHMLSLDLADKQALQVYQDHKEHLKVVGDWIKPNIEGILAMDIEFS